VKNDFFLRRVQHVSTCRTFCILCRDDLRSSQK